MNFNEITKESILNICDEYGFIREAYVEKLLMDMHISQILSGEFNFCFRGGLAFLLSTNLSVTPRLSVDIDMFTDLQKTEVTQKVSSILEKLGISYDINTISSPPIDNYVHIDIYYDSHFEDAGQIKLEIIHDVDLNSLYTQSSLTQNLLGYSLERSLTTLRKSGLLADKITALSMGTIGTKSVRDTIKHIHDIAIILRNVTGNEIIESFEMFQTLTQFKIKHHKNKPTLIEVIHNIEKFLRTTFDFEPKFKLTLEHKKYIKIFQENYVAKKHYQFGKHINDILLVWLYIIYIRDTLKSDCDIRTKAKELEEIINQNKSIIDTKKQLISKNISTDKSLYDLSLSQFHLYQEIKSRTVWNEHI